ncbi:AGAP009898-PA [Anopheles gambiae str. PEST]|uniref:AGAP009898-PA n=1 Tax=Anopheles gambiae TaxID=7165 RepID=Q5TP11_ANOGA|nr:AGAP009898-PA [Anopheles gambiae str. PEST]
MVFTQPPHIPVDHERKQSYKHAFFSWLQIRPQLTGGSKSELTGYIFGRMKSDLNDVPAQTAAGSTLPLVDMIKDDEEAGTYNPFENRKLTHPTTDMETLVHLLKGSLGSGILAMPLAFVNAGLWFGLVATVAIGAICTYCIHILRTGGSIAEYKMLKFSNV